MQLNNVLLYFNWNTLRTVRAQVADCPPYYSTDPPEPIISLDKLQSIRQTVHSPLADCPQYTYANPPETTTSLDQFLILPADCPAPLGGPSAVHVSNPPETATSLDKILNSNVDCPRPSGGPSAVQSCEPHQRHRLWTNFKFQRRTVHSPIADHPQFFSAKPPETTSSLDEN